MKLYRAMGEDEFLRLMKNETLTNYKKWKETNSSNAIGFCFFQTTEETIYLNGRYFGKGESHGMDSMFKYLSAIDLPKSLLSSFKPEYQDERMCHHEILVEFDVSKENEKFFKTAQSTYYPFGGFRFDLDERCIEEYNTSLATPYKIFYVERDYDDSWQISKAFSPSEFGENLEEFKHKASSSLQTYLLGDFVKLDEEFEALKNQILINEKEESIETPYGISLSTKHICDKLYTYTYINDIIDDKSPFKVNLDYYLRTRRDFDYVFSKKSIDSLKAGIEIIENNYGNYIFHENSFISILKNVSKDIKNIETKINLGKTLNSNDIEILSNFGDYLSSIYNNVTSSSTNLGLFKDSIINMVKDEKIAELINVNENIEDIKRYDRWNIADILSNYINKFENITYLNIIKTEINSILDKKSDFDRDNFFIEGIQKDDDIFNFVKTLSKNNLLNIDANINIQIEKGILKRYLNLLNQNEIDIDACKECSLILGRINIDDSIGKNNLINEDILFHDKYQKYVEGRIGIFNEKDLDKVETIIKKLEFLGLEIESKKIEFE